MSSFKLTPSYGGYYVSSASATTIGGASTPVKAAGTTTTFVASSEVDAGDATDNRFLFSGTHARKFKVDVAATLKAASGTDQVLEISAKKYDASGASTAAITGAVAQVFAPATNEMPVAMSFVVELDTDDYFEIYVANNTGAVNVTAHKMQVTAIGLET